MSVKCDDLCVAFVDEFQLFHLPKNKNRLLHSRVHCPICKDLMLQHVSNPNLYLCPECFRMFLAEIQPCDIEAARREWYKEQQEMRK